MRRHALVSCLAVLVLPIAGCITPLELSGGSPQDDSSSTSATSTTASRAGRQLTQAEVDAVVPTVPVDATASDDEVNARDLDSDPDECLDVLLLGETATDLKGFRVASTRRSWTVPQDDYLEYSITVSTHSRPIGPELLDRAGSAMSSCDAFPYTGQDERGPFDLRVLTDPRTVQNFGDQTFANRITSHVMVDGQSTPLYLDQLVVRIGHNLLRATQYHADSARTFADLEGFIDQMVKDLEEQP